MKLDSKTKNWVPKQIYDRLGSVIGVNGNLGTPEATYAYEPYGLPRSTTGTLANPMRFIGQYTDADTGLQYLRARYYDQGTGRFLSPDPVPSPITDPYVATYVYANGRPTVANDPSGLFCILCLGTLSIVLKGVAVVASTVALLASAPFAVTALAVVAAVASLGSTVIDCRNGLNATCAFSAAATVLGGSASLFSLVRATTLIPVSLALADAASGAALFASLVSFVPPPSATSSAARYRTPLSASASPYGPPL